MASKALKAAIGDLHRDPMLSMDEIPLKVNLWRVLVQPLPPMKTNAGGMIAMPDVVQDAEAIRTSVGRVLQLGSMAFKSTTQSGLKLFEEPVIPSVGDFVLYQSYAGQEIALRGGTKLRVILDTEILGVVHEPDEIRNYI